jgi:hypothetical protein
VTRRIRRSEPWACEPPRPESDRIWIPNVVERIFTWRGRHRHLRKHDEASSATEEAWLRLTMGNLMLARLAR